MADERDQKSGASGALAQARGESAFGPGPGEVGAEDDGLVEDPSLLPGTLEDGVDPELLALSAPPSRRLRAATFVAMAAAVAAAIALGISLRADVAYFFAASRAHDLGEVTQLAPGNLATGRYVRLRGNPMAAHTVTYERLLGGGHYALFPLAGQRDVFVQVPLHGESLGRLARRDFAGRLTTFGELGGRIDTVRASLEADLGAPVGPETFLLLADEPPRSHAWALGLVGLCLLLALANLVMLLRLFRPLPLAAPERRPVRTPAASA